MSGRRKLRPRLSREPAGRKPGGETTEPRPGTKPGPVGQRFAALAAAGLDGEAGRLVERAVQAAIADDADALGRAAGEACADAALAGVVVTVLAHVVAAATSRDGNG